MQDTKLVQLLVRLSKPELKALDRFIDSPYFNTNNTVIKLWKYIKKYAPHFTSKMMNDEKIHSRLFPNKNFNERTIRQLRFQLLKLVEEFLKVQKLQKTPFFNSYLLAKSYQELQYEKELKSVYTTQIEKTALNQNAWSYLHKMQWLEFQYFSDTNTKLVQNPDSIQMMEKALELFSLGGKLKFACEFASWNQIMGKDFNINSREEIEKICNEKQNKLPSFHQLFWAALKLIENPEEDNYLRLKLLFLKCRVDLAIEEQIILLTYLLNFTFKEIQRNSSDYVEEAFRLYKYGLENSLFVINRKFIEDHFINVLTICSNLKETAWADNFLKELELETHPSIIIGASAYYISIARLEFAKENFKSCLDKLTEINHGNIIHSTKARYTAIACYIELVMPVELIRANCKSLTSFVKRNLKQKKELQLGCINFCKVVRELLSFYPNKEKMTQILQKDNDLVFRDWLIIKVDACFNDKS